eukprot:305316-Amphidinium_carterae.1
MTAVRPFDTMPFHGTCARTIRPCALGAVNTQSCRGDYHWPVATCRVLHFLLLASSVPPQRPATEH